MKNLLLLTLGLVLLASCDQEKDNPCQIVSAELVPQIVKDSLSVRYPGVVPITWLNKDNTGYCVNFQDENGNGIIALFSNAGNFVGNDP